MQIALSLIRSRNQNKFYWTAMLYFSHITQIFRVNDGFCSLCVNMFYWKLLGSHFHRIIYGKRYSRAITTFVPNTIICLTLREQPYHRSTYIPFQPDRASNHRYCDIIIEHIILYHIILYILYYQLIWCGVLALRINSVKRKLHRFLAKLFGLL